MGLFIVGEYFFGVLSGPNSYYCWGQRRQWRLLSPSRQRIERPSPGSRQAGVVPVGADQSIATEQGRGGFDLGAPAMLHWRMMAEHSRVDVEFGILASTGQSITAEHDRLSALCMGAPALWDLKATG